MTTNDEKTTLGVEMLYAKFADQPYVTKANWNTHRKFILDPNLNQTKAAYTADPLYTGQVNYEFTLDPLFLG